MEFLCSRVDVLEGDGALDATGLPGTGVPTLDGPAVTGYRSLSESWMWKYIPIPFARTAMRFATSWRAMKSVGANREYTRSPFKRRAEAASGARFASDFATKAAFVATMEANDAE